MSKIIALCSFVAALMLASPSHAAELGTSCSNVGVTQMSDDKVTILACLKTSASNGALVWKSMTPVTSVASTAPDGLAIGQLDGDNTQSIQTYIDTTAGRGGYGNWSYAGGCCHPLLLNPHGGLVGVGTTSPTRMLDVSGDINATRGNGTGAYYFASDWNRYLYFDGTNYSFGGGGLYVNKSGNVGVGTGGPAAKLEVAGGIKLSNAGEGCGGGAGAGTIRWVGSLQVCDGNNWGPVGGGLTYVGSCQTPTAFRNTTSCKCNAGETLMLMSGYSGWGNWGDSVNCTVNNQNTTSVVGTAYYAASVQGYCTYSCFK